MGSFKLRKCIAVTVDTFGLWEIKDPLTFCPISCSLAFSVSVILRHPMAFRNVTNGMASLLEVQYKVMQ